MTQFAIDLPPYDPDDAWQTVGYFDTESEAIGYAMEKYGAGPDGRVQLVSRIPLDDDDSRHCPGHDIDTDCEDDPFNPCDACNEKADQA